MFVVSADFRVASISSFGRRCTGDTDLRGAWGCRSMVKDASRLRDEGTLDTSLFLVLSSSLLLPSESVEGTSFDEGTTDDTAKDMAWMGLLCCCSAIPAAWTRSFFR